MALFAARRVQMSCSLVEKAIVLRCMGSICFAAGLLWKVCVTRHSSTLRNRAAGIVKAQLNRHNYPSALFSVAIFQFVQKIFVYDLLKYVANFIVWRDVQFILDCHT